MRQDYGHNEQHGDRLDRYYYGNIKERVSKNRCKICNYHPISKGSTVCRECSDKNRRDKTALSNTKA